MALEAWELVQRQNGNIAGAEMARVLREQYGDVALPLASASEPEPHLLNLDSEWLRQANKMADVFAKPLGKSKEEYMDSLPKFTPQPKSRLNIPVLVQIPVQGFSLNRMLEVLEIANYVSNLGKVKDWSGDPQGFRTPDSPYATWVNDGSINLSRSVNDVRRSLTPDERGGNVFDGLALYLRDPEVLKHHFIDLPGSEYGSDSAPYLAWWSGRPGFDYGWTDVANPGCGSVVAGRNIVTR